MHYPISKFLLVVYIIHESCWVAAVLGSTSPFWKSYLITQRGPSQNYFVHHCIFEDSLLTSSLCFRLQCFYVLINYPYPKNCIKSSAEEFISFWVSLLTLKFVTQSASFLEGFTKSNTWIMHTVYRVTTKDWPHPVIHYSVYVFFF